MNILTLEIKQKGYTLNEFISELGISLRTYRRYEKPDNAMNAWLVAKINKLESK